MPCLIPRYGGSSPVWFQRMRQGGFQGILKQPRSDRGQPRRSIEARVTRAVALKREQPLRSDRVINQILKAELGSVLPSSTIYRHLRIHGATRKRLGVANRQTRLSAWIDAHSRYILARRYYLNENTGCLVDSLLPIFHLCEYRAVEPTFSDVVLKNTFYQVDPKLRGLRLRVHFDPFVDETGMPANVELYSEQGVFLGVGRRYERQRGSHEHRPALARCCGIFSVCWPNHPKGTISYVLPGIF